MGLRNFFTALVTAEDGMDTTSQRFLSSAIKLGRPPMDCVVFESNPVGITAAHNCSCKVKSWSKTMTSMLKGTYCQQDAVSLSEVSIP